MDEKSGREPTVAERISERETMVTRSFAAPARIVYAAWTQPELLKRWWAPKSYGIAFISCEADVRIGGSYRFVFGQSCSDQEMEFFGRYLEVVPDRRLVWTNDEGGENGAITTVTFEERGDETVVVMRELYSSKEALDEAIASGSAGGICETLDQLDEVLGELS